MLVVGGQEEAAGTVAVRSRDSGEQETVGAEEFADRVVKEMVERKA
jgi:threonyl-tRNA synthetase